MTTIVCPYCGQGARPGNITIDMREIGSHLRKWRKEHGYTLKDVCEEIGITPPHLSDIERTNRGASIETLAKLMDFYGICFEYVPASVVIAAKQP